MLEVAFTLDDFVRESNRIEGILRDPTPAEIAAHEAFLDLPVIGVRGLEAFVAVIAPGKPMRRFMGQNVRVGNHIAPRGGPEIERELQKLLDDGYLRGLSAFKFHMAYETLHPFMDGNGRSGRALWLHLMGGIEQAPLGFLHHWYYQSLSGWRSAALAKAHAATSEASAPTPEGDRP
jgi:hypothetical protein